ncbi:MAG: ABC transporter permease subunit, partial [Deinococcus sp.]
MIRLVQLSGPGRYRPLWVSLSAVAVALLIAGGVFAAYGVSPLDAYGQMFNGTLMDPQGRSEVLRRATPLLLTGVGLTLAFRAQFFNIGAEGQILVGAILAGGVALFTPLPGVLMPAV